MGLRGREGWSKSEKKEQLMDMDNSVMVVGGRGIGGGVREYRGDKL